MLKSIYSKVVGGLTKYLVAILIGLLLATGLAATYIYHELDTARQKGAQAAETIRQYQSLTEAQKAAQEADKALYEGTIKSLGARATKAEAQAKHFKEQNHDLQAALSANPGWRDSPVPVGVREALQRPYNR